LRSVTVAELCHTSTSTNAATPSAANTASTKSILKKKEMEGVSLIELLLYKGSAAHPEIRESIASGTAILDDVDIVQGQSALMKFAQSSDAAMVRLLVDAKADMDIMDKRGGLALCYALGKEDPTCAILLVQAGARHWPHRYSGCCVEQLGRIRCWTICAILLASRRFGRDIARLLATHVWSTRDNDKWRK
jgi:hypothetical protein